MRRKSGENARKEDQALLLVSELELQMAPDLRHLAIVVVVAASRVGRPRGAIGVRRRGQGKGYARSSPCSLPTIRSPLRRPVLSSATRYSRLNGENGNALAKSGSEQSVEDKGREREIGEG